MEKTQWLVPMRLTIYTQVRVEAASSEEARSLAKSFVTIDDGRQVAECVYPEVIGEAVEV